MCTKKVLPFTGSATAIVTPMRYDGEIDYAAFERLIEFQISNGSDALVICGTTGESATLDDHEKSELTRLGVRAVDSRVPVIVGTGSNSTRHSIELSKEAYELGADALLLVTPYYNKTSQDGLVRHFEAVADSTPLPVILYSVPSRTGVNITPETCQRLKTHERICAIKEASGDISQIARIRALCGDELYVYSGNDDQTLPILSLGGKGVISVFSNICPRVSHDICALWNDGKASDAAALFLDYLDLMNALFCDVNPLPVKEALNIMGFAVGKCRAPLYDVSQKASDALRYAMSRHGLI